MADAPERRRHPRIAVADHVQICVPVVYEVEVVDLSRSGMLLAADARVETGTRGQVRVVLGGKPFAASVEVKRVADRAPGARASSSIGVAFTGLDAQSEQVLESYVPVSKPAASVRRVPSDSS
jgi:hypothetical protein